MKMIFIVKEQKNASMAQKENAALCGVEKLVQDFQCFGGRHVVRGAE